MRTSLRIIWSWLEVAVAAKAVVEVEQADTESFPHKVLTLELLIP
jgi:hypothetical protein